MTYIEYFFFLVFIVMLSPIVFILAISWTFFVIGSLDKIFGEPALPPYCDIDPLCHPAFAWNNDGSGWIGNICVRKAKKI